MCMRLCRCFFVFAVFVVDCYCSALISTSVGCAAAVEGEGESDTDTGTGTGTGTGGGDNFNFLESPLNDEGESHEGRPPTAAGSTPSIASAVRL